MRKLWIAVVVVFAGCTHPTEFVHEKPDFESVAPVLTRSLRLSVRGGPETDDRLGLRVADALRLAPVAAPARAVPANAPADYTIELHVKRRAMSRGTNFLICWPGFLVFAPAWHGLEWPYRVNTLAIVTRADGTTLEKVQRSDLYTCYSTTNGYGIGAGLGWFPPLYSAPAFATGIVASFVPEEGELHREFVLQESEEWARAVASDILRAIAADPAPAPDAAH